jgi:hypothetical protein
METSKVKKLTIEYEDGEVVEVPWREGVIDGFVYKTEISWSQSREPVEGCVV